MSDYIYTNNLTKHCGVVSAKTLDVVRYLNTVHAFSKLTFLTVQFSTAILNTINLCFINTQCLDA